jgi:hypothetical protein
MNRSLVRFCWRVMVGGWGCKSARCPTCGFPLSIYLLSNSRSLAMFTVMFHTSSFVNRSFTARWWTPDRGVTPSWCTAAGYIRSAPIALIKTQAPARGVQARCRRRRQCPIAVCFLSGHPCVRRRAYRGAAAGSSKLALIFSTSVVHWTRSVIERSFAAWLRVHRT